MPRRFHIFIQPSNSSLFRQTTFGVICDENTLSFGFAQTTREDNFCRKIGRTIAFGRATKRPVVVNVKEIELSLFTPGGMPKWENMARVALKSGVLNADIERDLRAFIIRCENRYVRET